MNLFGNEFGNTIIGNAGENSLIGGMGRDILIGNSGGDGFYWTSTAETADTYADADVVWDFLFGVDKFFSLLADRCQCDERCGR